LSPEAALFWAQMSSDDGSMQWPVLPTVSGPSMLSTDTIGYQGEVEDLDNGDNGDNSDNIEDDDERENGEVADQSHVAISVLPNSQERNVMSNNKKPPHKCCCISLCFSVSS